jgi:hypothetical protein
MSKFEVSSQQVAIQGKIYFYFFLFWGTILTRSESGSGSTELLNPDPIRTRNQEQKSCQQQQGHYNITDKQ